MRIERLLLVLAMMASLALFAAACGEDEGESGSGDGGGAASEEELSGPIRIDGSSTVFPFAEAAGELFNEEVGSGVQVTVGQSGTGGGFEKFCAGETDISDASRAIEEDEIAACRDSGIAYEEFQVANDGISVVVNPENDWAQCLTVDQLKTIWNTGSKATSWKDVDPSFPDEELSLYGPGTDSGTFDFFTEQINGEEGASRSDYNATEDDNVTVQGVSGDKGGLGYFGLSYLEQNTDSVKGVEVDGGRGCVAPSSETVQDGSYTPLSRPLFIYVKADSLSKPEVEAFVEYYLENTATLAEQALFVPLTDEQQSELQPKLDALKATAGT
jgi:phosphate transport system substrate-binding protein